MGGPSPGFIRFYMRVDLPTRCSDPDQLTRPERDIGIEGESSEERKK